MAAHRVASGFVAVPFQVQTADYTHSVYVKHHSKSDASSPENDAKTLFAANIPAYATQKSIADAFLALLRSISGKSLPSSAISSVDILPAPQSTKLSTLLVQELENNKVHQLFSQPSTSTFTPASLSRPSTSARITFKTTKLLKLVLSVKHLAEPIDWPSAPPASSNPLHSSIFSSLHDIARPSLANVIRHTDEWMSAFETSQSSSLPAPAPTLSKKAKARATAEYERQAKLRAEKASKAIYDDDPELIEVRDGDWTTVVRGGKHGRSIEQEETEFMPDAEKEKHAKKLEYDEGFISGKRSVGVAKRGFGTTEEPMNPRKRKKTGGIETALYGFDQRNQKIKGLSELRAAFERDKEKIAELKRQKRMKPY